VASSPPLLLLTRLEDRLFGNRQRKTTKVITHTGRNKQDTEWYNNNNNTSGVNCEGEI